MKNLTSTIVVLFSVIFFSCKNEAEHGLVVTDSVSEAEPSALYFSSGAGAGASNLTYSYSVSATATSEKDNAITASQVDKKKIIKDGNVSIKVEDIELAKKRTDSLVKNLNGYYDREAYDNGESEISYDLTVRIPSEKFETILALVENGIGELTQKNISSRDVTEEYIDVETRLNNKKSYLKKYNELLGKATTVKDIMAIEENVRTLQEEIESKEGRLKYLNDQVEYSTLSIKLFKEKEYVFKPGKEDKFSERLKNSLDSGWKGIVNSILWLIKHWPLLIVVAAIFILWKRRRR